MSLQAIYAAFDLYPSSKGAATHMHYMIKALHSQFNQLSVYALGKGVTPEEYAESGISYHHFKEAHPNYLRRAEIYVDWLREKLMQQGIIELAHFRDIWSGMAILNDHRIMNTLFEVNGFPSIELPYRYPQLSTGILDKIRELEYDSLVKSDMIICPSETIKRHIIEYGIKPDHVQVITNGAELIPQRDKPAGLPKRYLVYFGAVQPWQGVDVLLKAFYQLRDYQDLYLVICSSQVERYTRHYQKLARKLELENRIKWYFELEKEQLAGIIQHADLSVAPLKETSRNIRQGCSPLKIFESMANRTTVVASDIPAVKEIIEDKVDGRLVRPDRPAELARVIRFLLDNPDRNEELARKGKEKIEHKFQWTQIEGKLIEVYNKLIFI